MPKTYPSVANVLIKQAGQECSFDFPEGTKEFTLKTRGNNDLKMAYEPGEIKRQNFVRIPGKSSKTVSDLNGQSALAIFFVCDVANEILEIEYWK